MQKEAERPPNWTINKSSAADGSALKVNRNETQSSDDSMEKSGDTWGCDLEIAHKPHMTQFVLRSEKPRGATTQVHAPKANLMGRLHPKEISEVMSFLQLRYGGLRK